MIEYIKETFIVKVLLTQIGVKNSFLRVSVLSKMFVSERRNKILDLLIKQHRITVKELSEQLNVSEATLRTDLTNMETDGVLKRTHGGAVLVEHTKSENTFSIREKKNRDEKITICTKAAELIFHGQCILLDASSTALELARILKNKHLRLTVVTNGMHTALELKENPEITVIVVGGVLRVGSASLEGTFGSTILNQINVDTMFTSASGFTIEQGLTDFNVYEVELKKLMVNSSTQVVALLDHSKIGKNSIATFATTNQVDKIITDSQIHDDCIKQLTENHIQLTVAQ